MKGLMLMAAGFEDTEAIACHDVLKRAGMEITLASVTNELSIVTQYGIEINCHQLLINVDLSDYDILIIPGGRAVPNVLHHLPIVDETITQFVKNNKKVAAICAAPSLIGKLGYYKNERYTCFSSNDYLIVDGKRDKEPVVISGNFITGKSMYYSIEFGLAIVEALYGKEKSEALRKNLMNV